MQQRELPSLEWRRWRVLPLHCSQCPLQKGMEGPCWSLSSSNRGMLEGGDGGSPVVGLLVGHRCSSLHREYKPGSLCKSQQSKRVEVNSATLLKAMQMPLKCDNKACLVTDKHRQFGNFVGKAQVLSHKLYL